MQHGKVVKNNIHYEDIIEYLEKFIPSSKMPSDKSSGKITIQQEIINSVKPVFDEFKSIDMLFIAYWGRFYKYECSGEKCDISYECDDLNEHIDEEIYQQIIDLYADAISPSLDDRVVEKVFGWPDRGGVALGVRRREGGLEVFTEDYDFE